ncbi:uncharacterized protein LOC129777211 isoform X2 [Toxorhynchites rutilus septentrionalis]|uniref:uncharacterized protein LOC129777211 isoform X2 n=1 Tax=Toxorhynchites rutilus septentrionalis TaxID=329112 RepID=UPI00247A88C9|nr:uncharacterized protein LOC129777211 isoform X2 [Toxorhynchites rutilus septentrionalis]
MSNLFIVIGSMLFVVCWLVEAKPQGCYSCGSSHKEITEKCCNKCELCRVSFDVEKPADPECVKPRNYSYNVQHFKTNCREETFDTLNAEIEAPPDPKCPKYHPKYYRVKKPPVKCFSAESETHDVEIDVPVHKKRCKKLKLTAKIDYKPRHCECDCGE